MNTKCVPVEPNEEMQSRLQRFAFSHGIATKTALDAYKTGVAAAPQSTIADELEALQRWDVIPRVLTDSVTKEKTVLHKAKPDGNWVKWSDLQHFIDKLRGE